MSDAYRRYEFLLPRTFNDGRPVPPELYARTLLDIREQFGPVSCETQVIQGIWPHGGLVYRDDLMRVFVDVPDTEANRQFFRGYKEVLKTRFEQLEIWMTSHAIEAI